MDSRGAKVEKTQDDDRISALPDGVLCHILSFLPTKYAVATTILSTRWKYLFTTLPNLEFNDSLLLRPEDGINMNTFTTFVYRVLLLRQSSHINRFSLTCHGRYDSSHLNAWIRSALWRNVKELDISVCVEEFGTFPSEIFTCRTLVNLELFGECILSVPFSVCLPNLKVMHLVFLKFTDDDSIRGVFSGCPVLEELMLNKCRLENIQTLDISIPSLKRLELYGYGGNYQIVLDAPVLEYFYYSDCVAGGYLVKDLKSLVTAHLLVWPYDDQTEEDSLRYGHSVAKLVNEISCAKILHLSGRTLEAIGYSTCSLPAFRNLTHLEVGVDITNGWQLLPNLLENSPNLEVLDFVQGFLNYSVDEWEVQYCLPESVPICLSQCLKEIVIRDFGGEEDELKLLEYFLNNCQVLKKITINIDTLEEWPSDICQWLFMFPKCSKKCQIVLQKGKYNKHSWWGV